MAFTKEKMVAYYQGRSDTPELPEVETIHRQLYSELDGLTSSWALSVCYQMGTTFQPSILKRLQRKGKAFCWYTDTVKVYSHLRMSGQFRLLRSVANSMSEIAATFPHMKAVFTFDHATHNEKSFRIVFTDTRGFGVCEVTPNYETVAAVEHPKLRLLGADPTYPGWTVELLATRLENVTGSRKIGTVLLDQGVVCGIGNIYRSEILHAAGVLPSRSVRSLSDGEVGLIYHRTNEILAAAIQARGCSMTGHQSTYVDLYGNKGEYASQLRAYQRQGERCLSCKSGVIFQAELEKNRNVYWCPDCQR